ncbi:MAG: type II methionyl aminopeptidase [Marine Group I thaumarchaeote]|jgi:methionyl aminopeptidase|uniref:Methionine aminopeptidase n=1 Tax=Marine Group I thaumarchaeote TaxID=2511932 RepID=A0A7K4MYA0_9ARCH|nr:type II methionyl aminopeptidase [Marine Group I thaumarchaeote]NWJ68207.1 type II methionyl aminopeptidase [Marine Group I thaumarchaeote]NWJ77687.1 type II methionyl aminopeptidase [Marine Group I thaumarchaeote]
MQIEDYVKAGKIAGEVRENVRQKDWIGSTLAEICDYVESEIIKRGAKCAFPVNTSLNEVAAHYTAEPNDPKTVSDSDLVKIDLGAQINGYIADTAVTVNYDPQYDSLVQAAENALQAAMSMIKVGVKSKDVGRKIQNTIMDMGLKPIANLSGHSLDQYTIHAGKTVPNMWTIGSFSFSENEAFACEPFVTTKNALGFVRNGKIKNIFALASRKMTKDDEADKLLEYIWNNFNMLPFALRWIVKEWEEKEARRLLDFLIKKKVVKAYAILVEANGKTVAQAEHTFIPTQTGVTVTTIG